MTKNVEQELVPLPKAISLSKTETASLANIGDKKAAIDKFVKTVVATGEARLTELNKEGRDIWSKLAETHNLDLTNVNYAISDDGKTLMPVGMNLVPSK